MARHTVFRNHNGYSIIELTVSMAVLAIILSTAISTLNPSARALDNAGRELGANLRLARAKAVATGYHYQVTVSSTSYDVNRMILSAGNWVIDGGTPTRTIVLPTSVSVPSVPAGPYQFDSRGNCVGASAPCLSAASTVTLHHAAQNRDLSVTVWPSGQVY